MFDTHVAYKARQTPRAAAVLTPAGPVAYAALDADVNRLAAALMDLGLSPASGVVSLRFADPYLRLAALLALARRGVASSPAADQRPDVRLADAPDAQSGAQSGAPLIHLSRERLTEILAAPPRPLPPVEIDPDAPARIMLSSGTTGVPRRIAYSFRRIDAVLRSMLTTYATGGFQAWIPWTGVDSSMGLAVAVAAWATGGVCVQGFETPALPGWLETLPPTFLALTPIQLRALLAALPPGFQPRPDLRLVVAGSLLPPAVARQARLALTPDIHVIYGTTETSLIAHARAAYLERHPGMVGHVAPGARVRLVDDEGAPVPPGEAGLLLAAGERCATGYVGDPTASAERFPGGWFVTGDLARLTPEGLLVLEGRADERMNLGGRKFMPAEMENAALACPGVLDAACFAVPGPMGIDQPWLAVVTAPGFDRDGLTAHLATFRGLPAPSFAWTEEIPRNEMGKVDRRKLRDAVQAALRPGS